MVNPYSIAFVDDDEVFLEDIRAFLQSVFQRADKNIELFTYSNPQDFLWDLQDEKCLCEAYILDVKMPGSGKYASPIYGKQL